MGFRNFTYYRSGVVLAKFRISGEKVYCVPRDIKTMEFGPEREFSLSMEPFNAELDRRIAEAAAAVQREAIPDGHEKADDYIAEINGKQLRVERYVQHSGWYPLDFLVSEGKIVATIDNERHYIGLLVEDGWEAATPQAAMEDPLLSKPEYGMEFIGTEMIPMRDGVRLATDIYLPTQRKAGQKFPTVLIRTCYNKLNTAVYFSYVHYGYALVAQDTRGRELSEGLWQPIINEKDDGDDTLNWIAAQEWSDGGVGMIGPSYLSIVQWQAAASGNPHFKASISMVTGGVPLFDFPHRAGVLSPGTMAWITSMRNKNFAPEDSVRDDWNQVLKHRPIRDIPLVATGNENPFWNEWMEHEYYDGYWHRGNFLVNQHKINLPALYVTGWYDDVGPGSMQIWDMNKRNGRKNQKLVCGPWMHKMNVSRDIHNINYGPDAVRYDMFCMYMRWYDHFLKGVDNGIDREEPVDYFVIGENRWHKDTEWPPKCAVEKNLYLSSGDGASADGGGALTFDRPVAAGEDHYVYDPDDPTPFLIDVSENECLVPENYKDVELRDDVLVYTTEPLKEAVTIAGEPVAILYAASSAKDTDWVVRITDLDQAGNSIRMCDGIVRAKFRKSFIEPKLLLPGEIVRYEIPMTWISNRFEVGHRIRVEVTSGADNSIFCNTNTGLPIVDDVDKVVAEQTVYSGGDHCSRVILPIIE